jgi:uncharacterized protein YueI
MIGERSIPIKRFLGTLNERVIKEFEITYKEEKAGKVKLEY